MTNVLPTKLGPDLRFSVCSLTDLLGFSGHLEISYDLRTTIGEQAIQRLRNLEQAIALIGSEKTKAKDVVPIGLRIQRINDSVVCTMDLDDFLLPDIGQINFTGKSANELAEMFNPKSFGKPEEYEAAYESRLMPALKPVNQFLGIVARLHLFIQKRESASFFPGARTVISTGFRRPFRSANSGDDSLSANFAFSNAFLADQSLHGPHLFVDNNLIGLCSWDRLARNLLRFACYEWMDSPYDCLRDTPPTEDARRRNAIEVSAPKSLNLFRRQYIFRRLNASPLSYLQHLYFLRQSLSTHAVAGRSNPYIAHILDAVDRGLTEERVREVNPPKSFIYSPANDLEASIVEFREILETGKSPTRRLRHRREYLEREVHPELLDNEEYMAEMDAFDNKTVEVDIKPDELLNPIEFRDVLVDLGEEQVTGLLPFMSDNLSALAFPQD